VELRACGARVVHLVTNEDGAAACPSCGTLSTSVKGHAITRPRDLPYGDDPVYLVWHKRRWRCRETACGRASFTESVLQVPVRSRLTTRLRRACGAGIAEEFKDVQTAGAYSGMS
jgi:transposase